MANIYAFQAIRPKSSLTEHFAALPYDVYNKEEARQEVEREPDSFLRIDRAETQFDTSVDMYSDEVYQKAHDTLWELVQKKELIQDSHAAYYVYELTMNGRTQTGLVACADVDDYINGVIKKHENTRVEKELDRIRHIDVCDAQTGPIFLAYHYEPVIGNALKRAKETEPIFDFVSPDGIRHRGWMISAEAEIQEIQDAFQKISQIYIADGHHRAASAVKVALQRRKEHADIVQNSESDRFLSVLFAENELYIMAYNRVVADLNGYTEDEFLKKLLEYYEVKTLQPSENISPDKKGITGMYLGGKWYRMQIKEAYKSNDPVQGLDVSVLQNYVLDPILGIEDPKTDQRISFVGGIRGVHELEERVDKNGGAAFAMYPTSMEELFAVADAGKLMPPKSTWFEPKLRSGLFIHSLKESEGHTHNHTHGHSHTHTHDPQQIKAVLNRISRAIGHLESIKKMIENGRDCSEVLIQLSAVKSAINNTGKVILQDHIQHCLVDAVESGDMEAINELNKAIDRFMK